jgi:hypothetical protein
MYEKKTTHYVNPELEAAVAEDQEMKILLYIPEASVAIQLGPGPLHFSELYYDSFLASL